MPANPIGAAFSLRLAYAGDEIVGRNEGDTILWSVSRRQFLIGQPGATGSPPAVGAAGTAFISDGSAGIWGNDFSPQNLSTTGFISIGATPRATSAQINVGYGQTILAARNLANTADQALLTWGVFANDGMQVGVTGKANIRFQSSGAIDLFNATADRSMVIGPSSVNLNPDAQLSNCIFATTFPILGIFSRSTNSERNLAFFANLSGSASWNSAKYITYWLDCAAIPTGNPSGGGYVYENAGAFTHRGSGGTVTVMATA